MDLISQCAVNAWIIYQEMGGLKSCLDFLTEICVSLMAGKPQSDQSDEDQAEPSQPPPKRMKGSSVQGTIRYDKVSSELDRLSIQRRTLERNLNDCNQLAIDQLDKSICSLQRDSIPIDGHHFNDDKSQISKIKVRTGREES